MENILKAHEGGKLSVQSTAPINTLDDLSIIYTPGVGKVSSLVHKDQEMAKTHTIAGKTIAVVSDGSAVLGLGDIGPKAALPVMEGKAAIFKEFGGVDAFPICLDTNDTEEIIQIVKAISVNFAAINLEDISAPRCFEIERRLQEELDIPIMHDDQHGTAIVTVAALLGALELTGKKDIKVVVVGAGAAGYAVSKLIMTNELKKELSIADLKVIDSKGVLALDRADMNEYKSELAELTEQQETMSFEEALKDADVFIGLSKKDLLGEELIRSMNSKPIIFAMANPDPEVLPDVAKAAGASIVATGRSDFPNQINNALAYPGVFKGMLENGVQKATDSVKIAAAKAIYEYHKEQLAEENLLPSILDKEVVKAIAEAVR